MFIFIFSTRCHPLIYLARCHSFCVEHGGCRCGFQLERCFGQLKELSLSRSDQCCMVTEVYHLHAFSSLTNLSTEENSCTMCEKFCVRTQLRVSDSVHIIKRILVHASLRLNGKIHTSYLMYNVVVQLCLCCIAKQFCFY